MMLLAHMQSQPRTTLGAHAWHALKFVPDPRRSSLKPSSLAGLPIPLTALGFDAAACHADGLSASQCIRGGFRYDELEGVFEADVIGGLKAFDTVRSRHARNGGGARLRYALSRRDRKPTARPYTTQQRSATRSARSTSSSKASISTARIGTGTRR